MAPGGAAVILNQQFSTSYQGEISWAFWLKLPLGEYHKTALMISQHWCRQTTNHYLSQCWPRSLSHYSFTNDLIDIKVWFDMCQYNIRLPYSLHSHISVGCVNYVRVTTAAGAQVNLIHRSLNEIAEIWQITLSNVFSLMKIIVFLFKFHWSVFLTVQLTMIQYWLK